MSGSLSLERHELDETAARSLRAQPPDTTGAVNTTTPEIGNFTIAPNHTKSSSSGDTRRASGHRNNTRDKQRANRQLKRQLKRDGAVEEAGRQKTGDVEVEVKEAGKEILDPKALVIELSA